MYKVRSYFGFLGAGLQLDKLLVSIIMVVLNLII